MSDHTLTIPAAGFERALQVVERHRAKPTRYNPDDTLRGLLITLQDGRAVVGATNRYTGALATTDEVEEVPDRPPRPADVWRSIAVGAGAFASPDTGGVFAGVTPTRDVERLTNGAIDPTITLTVRAERMEVSGEGGALYWPRIKSDVPVDLPRLFDDAVRELKRPKEQVSDTAYGPYLLRLLIGPRVRAGDSIRFSQAGPNRPVVVTSGMPYVRSIQLIMPRSM